MRHDGRTREYVARRTVEGKSKREIMRCLKRYIAREIYHLPTGADGCGVCAISTEVSGNIAEHLKCPNLNIGASDESEREKPWLIDVGGRRFSMVIPPHNSSTLRAQYAHVRGESPRFAAVDRAKNRRKVNTQLCAFHGSYHHNAPSDRPARLAKRDLLGRLDVAQG